MPLTFEQRLQMALGSFVFNNMAQQIELEQTKAEIEQLKASIAKLTSKDINDLVHEPEAPIA